MPAVLVRHFVEGRVIERKIQFISFAVQHKSSWEHRGLAGG